MVNQLKVGGRYAPQSGRSKTHLRPPESAKCTVYRMVNMLEEIGAISRRNMYKVECSDLCQEEDAWIVVLDDESVCRISSQKWRQVIEVGLQECGYMRNRKVMSISQMTDTEKIGKK